MLAQCPDANDAAELRILFFFFLLLLDTQDIREWFVPPLDMVVIFFDTMPLIFPTHTCTRHKQRRRIAGKEHGGDERALPVCAFSLVLSTDSVWRLVFAET